jgi:mannan endo-1,6-alpha-mannosidase
MPQHRSWRDQIVLLPLLLLAPITGAITLDIDDRRTCLLNVLWTFSSHTKKRKNYVRFADIYLLVESIVDAASSAAYGMMIHYTGNETGQIPGKIPNTWWEGGAMFMALIQYWYYTGDTTYNSEVSTGMQWQAGDGDYMPSNYSSYIVRHSIPEMDPPVGY